MKEIYRQGDVVLMPVEKMPKKAKSLGRMDSYILAYGEVTGHQHELRANCEVFELEEEKYLCVNEDGKLVHGFANVGEEKQIGVDRHDTLTIKKGIYKLGNEREYDYLEKKNIRVID